MTGHNKRVLSVQTVQVFQKNEVGKEKDEMSQKCDDQNIKYFILLLLSKHEMFSKRDVQNMQCFRNVTFKILWNVSEMWYSK